jgi:acyl-CoA-binding protein
VTEQEVWEGKKGKFEEQQHQEFVHTVAKAEERYLLLACSINEN